MLCLFHSWETFLYSRKLVTFSTWDPKNSDFIFIAQLTFNQEMKGAPLLFHKLRLLIFFWGLFAGSAYSTASCVGYDEKQ